MIYYTFTLNAVDSWDNNDRAIIQFDSTTVTGGWNHSYGLSSTNYCGKSAWYDYYNNRIFGRVAHSAKSLTFRFVSGMDETAENESTFYKSLTMMFATSSDSTATTSSVCIVPTVSYTNGLCGCAEGYYLSGTTCIACNSLCSSSEYLYWDGLCQSS